MLLGMVWLFMVVCKWGCVMSCSFVFQALAYLSYGSSGRGGGCGGCGGCGGWLSQGWYNLLWSMSGGGSIPTTPWCW